MLTKKKLGEYFLRKDDRKQKVPETVQHIDESYFDINLIWQPNTLSLIKINAKIIKGDLTGQTLPLNCKWYTKTKFDFKQIQSVKASYYQPCLDDVGAMICVQIEPHLEGKLYNGVTIMKQIGPLQLPLKLQNQSQQLLKSQKITLKTKVQAIFSQDPRFQFIQQPLESQIIIKSSYIYFIRQSNNEEVCFYQITNNFPQIQFIKKSFNSILISFNMNESMRISFQDNYQRDLFVLIIRNIMVNLSYYRNTQPKQKENQQTTINQTHQNNQKLGNTLLILKIDQLNKQNKQLKKQYQQLLQNYHYQRQAKLKSIQQSKKAKEQKEKYRIEAQTHKQSDLKLKKQTSQNRFLLNENSLLKKDKKIFQEENTFLKNKIEHLSKYLSENRQQNKNSNIVCYSSPKDNNQSTQQLINKINTITEENSIIQEKYQKQIQTLQNQNSRLNKRIDSLLSEKVIISPQKQRHYDQNYQINSQKKQMQALKFQIKNLQMLLKYKIGEKGNQNINFQQIINKFTQIITQKQQQLEIQKKVNKQLTRKLNQKQQPDDKI